MFLPALQWYAWPARWAQAPGYPLLPPVRRGTSLRPPYPAPAAQDNGVEKPATDTRVYKHITLPNRLRVMIVSDPEAEKAAAAMSVNVGQLSDPEDIPGLAHFCEVRNTPWITLWCPY